ncbi:membrane protein insertion efficiency factor YidD [Massilia sp. NR 4-1]|uniref:membrane protein insertion efficiency factor YidD n=1 Tax=Massilia sp. NR 4-1 TaxID=1678028 RepID=UPI00067B9A5E|nr:membrane protein insertion efficiency factor YidD [Massilia sp. NR 4-1]
MLAKLVLGAIRAYQRYLSPYKGFSCCFRVVTGRDSCSGYGYRVIGRYGLRRGGILLHRRLCDCADLYAQLDADRKTPPYQLRYERGSWDALGCACDILDGASVAADCFKCWRYEGRRGNWRESPELKKKRERYQASRRQ